MPSVTIGAELGKHAMSFGDQQRSDSCSTKVPSLSLLHTLNVTEQVGTKCRKFGTLLLNDQKGNQVDIIQKELCGDVEDINTKILQYWLQGKGLPVTWENLLDTLKACSLNELADQIQSSLQP